METQELSRGRLIDHLHLVVRDLSASQDFYSAVLGALGVPVFSGALDHTVAIGKGMVSAARWRDNPAETSGELSAEGGVQLMTADVRIDMMTAGVAKVELSSADLASLVPTILLSGSHVELIGVTVDGDDVVDPYDAVTGEDECEESTE